MLVQVWNKQRLRKGDLAKLSVRGNTSAGGAGRREARKVHGNTWVVDGVIRHAFRQVGKVLAGVR